MLKTLQKIRIVNELVDKMDWAKSKKMNEETGNYEDDPVMKDENEFIEDMERIFVETAMKKINEK